MENVNDMDCILKVIWFNQFYLAVTCSPLVNPAFGTITPSTCTKGGFYNDICHFACLNGFRINGTAMRTCAIDGRWTGLNDTYCLGKSI